VGKHEGKRQLGEPKQRWEDIITIYLKEIGSNSLNWINLPQDTDKWHALVNTLINLWVP